MYQKILKLSKNSKKKNHKTFEQKTTANKWNQTIVAVIYIGVQNILVHWNWVYVYE